MITHFDISEIILTKRDMALAQRHAKNAEIGGTSHVRGKKDRRQSLGEDQLVGQLGTLAGHKLWFGTDYFYRLSRYHADLHPEIGDAGGDVPGANIDFKASKVRYPDKDFLTYRLPVRPAERHKNWIYVLVLVALEDRRAYVVGWASDKMLPKEPESEGVFKGAHIIVAKKLRPVPPIRWFK
jgi:hypothetical protein